MSALDFVPFVEIARQYLYIPHLVLHELGKVWNSESRMGMRNKKRRIEKVAPHDLASLRGKLRLLAKQANQLLTVSSSTRT